MSQQINCDSDQVLDVRDIDGEPFNDIMDALDNLEPDETLVLINSFEPEPLYSVLEQRGFDYETTKVADEEWQLCIEHA